MTGMNNATSGSDPVIKGTTWDTATGTVTVPARTVAVLVEKDSGHGHGPSHHWWDDVSDWFGNGPAASWRWLIGWFGG